MGGDVTGLKERPCSPWHPHPDSEQGDRGRGGGRWQGGGGLAGDRPRSRSRRRCWGGGPGCKCSTLGCRPAVGQGERSGTQGLGSLVDCRLELNLTPHPGERFPLAPLGFDLATKKISKRTFLSKPPTKDLLNDLVNCHLLVMRCGKGRQEEEAWNRVMHEWRKREHGLWERRVVGPLTPKKLATADSASTVSPIPREFQVRLEADMNHHLTLPLQFLWPGPGQARQAHGPLSKGFRFSQTAGGPCVPVEQGGPVMQIVRRGLTN